MKNKQVEVINFFKGISITAIILYHLIAFYLDVPNIIKIASNFGGAGVHIFLFCSGFGLAISQLNNPLNYNEFIKRRFIKIYIPYILVIFISFFTPIICENNRFIALLSHIFLFKMFNSEYISSFGMQFWYISTLFQFYFLFPLLIILNKKIGDKKFIIFSTLISFLWMLFTSLFNLANNRVFGSFFLQYLWEFSLGIVLANNYYNNTYSFMKKISQKEIVIITILSLILFGCTSFFSNFKSFNDFFSFLSFGGICLLLFNFNILKTIFTYVNKYSYEIYLTHILIFEICFNYFNNYINNYIVAFISIFLLIIISPLYKTFVSKIFFKRYT